MTLLAEVWAAKTFTASISRLPAPALRAGSATYRSLRNQMRSQYHDDHSG